VISLPSTGRVTHEISLDSVEMELSIQLQTHRNKRKDSECDAAEFIDGYIDGEYGGLHRACMVIYN
jgi:hypothetical protein